MTAAMMRAMKIRQYVYFGIKSEVLTADEIAQRVGLAPDRAVVRASRTADPPRPCFHVWEIRCDESGLRIDEQIERVIVRVEPVGTAIRDLIAEPSEVHAWLQMVRYFGVGRARRRSLTKRRGGLVKLSRTAPASWLARGPRRSELLVNTGADLNADEYG